MNKYTSIKKMQEVVVGYLSINNEEMGHSELAYDYAMMEVMGQHKMTIRELKHLYVEAMESGEGEIDY